MTLEQFCKSNIIWLATTLIAVGAFVATVKFQANAVAELQSGCNDNSKKIVALEKLELRLENIDKNLIEMKYDIKDIKGIVYRPAISYNIVDE